MSERDDLLDEIGELLAVAPSRGFADGVRRRIGRRRHVMRLAIPGLAVAASLLLALVIQSPDPVQPVAKSATAPLASAANVGALDVAPPIAAAPAPMSQVEAPIRQRRPRRVNIETPAAEPDRLRVFTNQLAVLQELWAAPVAPPVEASAAVQVAIAPLQPIEIAPLEVALLPDPWAVDARDPKPGWPVIRRAVQSGEPRR